MAGDRYPTAADLRALQSDAGWPLTTDVLECEGNPVLCDDRGCERDRTGLPCPWRDGWDREECVDAARAAREVPDGR